VKGVIKMMNVERKFQLVGIDLMKPGPTSVKQNEYVLVCTDYATKWAKAIPIPNKEAKTVAVALWENWICTFGMPEEIISDNGGEFTADEMKTALMEVSGIKQHLITPYNPRANGQVERFNKTLANRLAKYTGEHQNTWDEYVSTVCWDYNMAKHSATGESPYFLVFGQEPKKGLDALIEAQKVVTYDIKKWKDETIPAMLERMKVAQKSRRKKQRENMKKKNEGRVNLIYRVGEKVWVRNEPRTNTEREEHKKLKLPWDGPYKIVKANLKKYGNSYLVRGIFEGKEEERPINIKNLKRYVERPEWMKLADDWVDTRKVEEDRMEVDQDKSGNYVPEIEKAPRVQVEPREKEEEEPLEKEEEGPSKRPTRGWI
jgi:hypothetical protein